MMISGFLRDPRRSQTISLVEEHRDQYSPPTEVLNDPIKYAVAKVVNEDNGSQEPTKIIIHHSVTPADNNYEKVLTAINRSHAKRVHGLQPSNQLQDKYPDVSYHYIIFPDGHIEQTRRESRIGRGTRQNNDGVIHINLIGNFTNYEPTDKQYESLNKKIADIQSRRAIGLIKTHGQMEGEHTACAGKKFDLMKVDQVRKRSQPPVDPNYIGRFTITRYYSCRPEQTRYLSREVNVLKKKLERDPTLEELFIECNRRQFNGDVDNLQPATGSPFTNKDAGIAVACPPEIPLRTKLRMNGYNQTLICRDRGSAIINKRLDLYIGAGDRAVDNYKKFPSGDHDIYYVR